MILLTCIREPVFIGVQMKTPLLMSLLSFPPGRRPLGPEARAHGLVTSSPAVAGDGTPSLFPPSQGFGGPGAPPTTTGEVAQTFRSHSEETSAKAKRGSCETTNI
jgi:hypothetical protein